MILKNTPAKILKQLPKVEEIVVKEPLLDLTELITKACKNNPHFDPRWLTLISSKPFLFENSTYVHLTKNIDNRLLPEEIELYKQGKIRTCYSTLEQLIYQNLKYFHRIITCGTMLMDKFVVIDDETYFEESGGFQNIIQEIFLTPTKLYCCACLDLEMTIGELNYGYSLPEGYLEEVTDEDRLNGINYVIQKNWDKLNKHPNFQRFHEINAFRLGVDGFRACLSSENIDNDSLGQICKKFTKSTLAVTKQQLNSIHLYVEEVNTIHNKLYRALEKCLLPIFNNDHSKFSIYVFSNEFYIFSERFSLKVSKDPVKNTISKDYLSNSYECFMAETYLYDSIKEQIEWAKYKEPLVYEYDKDILKGILENMLHKDFKKVVMLKRPTLNGAIDYENNIVSKITFTGIFKNVKIHEKFMLNNKVIYEQTKCLSKRNAADYLINRGYYHFGYIDELEDIQSLNQKSLINLYSNNTIPVWKHIQPLVNKVRREHMEMLEIIETNGKPSFKVYTEEEAYERKKLRYVKFKSSYFNEYDIGKSDKIKYRKERHIMTNVRVNMNQHKNLSHRQKNLLKVTFNREHLL